MSVESMQYDVIIVGGGPAGLSAAIKLKQLNNKISVCLLEKGSEIGTHILSGNVFETRALDELIPEWKEKNAPLVCQAKEDRFYFLTQHNRVQLPTPPQMKNQGNYIISLANLCRWLARQAEDLGVEIYPGFSGTAFLKNKQEKVIGIKTGEKGLNKQGLPTAQYQPGMDIYASQVLLAEGCRGSLTEESIKTYQLREVDNPQTYALGFKEVWHVDPQKHRSGLIEHSIGWPMSYDTYGGSFLYHFEKNQILVGYIIGLDYKNPYLSPFDEFQRFKLHPKVRPLFEGATRIAYGARALNEGGWQALPRLVFPGGSLIGCGAGFMNVPKIKGSHTAMKSGMLAAEGVYEALQGRTNDYQDRLEKSWVATELKEARNIRPGFKYGLLPGLINAAFETYIMQGRSPWTFKHHPDHKSLILAKDTKPIEYPKPDGQLTFDRLSSVYLCHMYHSETQPNHLKLRNSDLAIHHNYELYHSPEQRYCPAGVYEIVEENEHRRLQINSANCIHCKTCDIKDPLQNIHWTPPEGGSGPNYEAM